MVDYYFLDIIPYETLFIYSVLFLIAGLALVIFWYYNCYLKRKNRVEQDLLITCALDKSPDAMFIRGMDGSILLCNSEFARFVCMSKSHINGLDISEIFTAEICEQLNEIEQRTRITSDSIRFESMLRTSTGNSMYAEVSISNCSKFSTTLYVLKDISEQQRVLNGLVKRDKLLYALTCGTQGILDTSQDFEHALKKALEEFCVGAGANAVIMAQSVTAESCGYNVGYDASLYSVYNLWSDGIDLSRYCGNVFEVKSRNIVFDMVLEQEKIIFLSVDQVSFITGLEFDSKDILGFYATAIVCQGIKWGLLLLGFKEIKEKWDEEIEEVIEISASQFGVLLERRKSEESIHRSVAALKRSQNRLNLALEAAGAASFEYDLVIDKFDVDRTLGEKLKYDTNWTIQNLDDMKSLIHPDDLDEWHDRISVLLNGDLDFIREDIRMRMSGGKYLWVTMMASTIIESDVICGLTGVFQDIDDKMESQNRLFNAEKQASIGALSTAIANNFNYINRNLIVKLKDLLPSEHLLDGTGKRIISDCIVDIENSIDIASNLVALSPGKDESLGLVNPNKLIFDIITMVRRDFSDNNIIIRHDLNPEIPSIFCNSNDLMHVIVNLLMNARQAMTDSETRVVTVSTTVDADAVLISIRDSGCGMSEELQQMIFEPFYTTKTCKEGGTGLGLSVSHLLIDKYNGCIEVSSIPGEGSEFVVVLPVSVSEETIDEILPIDDD